MNTKPFTIMKQKGFTLIELPSLRVKLRRANAFTLVELLVVISVIGLLASVILVSLNSARAKARDAKRASDIRRLVTSLELYYDANNAYPIAAMWFGDTGNCWGTVTSNWIPDLVPTYLAALPLDPKPTNCGSVYLYGSNGIDYKVMAHVPEDCENPAYKNLKDALRDGGTDPVIVDGNSCWAWSFHTPGAVTW